MATKSANPQHDAPIIKRNKKCLDMETVVLMADFMVRHGILTESDALNLKILGSYGAIHDLKINRFSDTQKVICELSTWWTDGISSIKEMIENRDLALLQWVFQNRKWMINFCPEFWFQFRMSSPLCRATNCGELEIVQFLDGILSSDEEYSKFYKREWALFNILTIACHGGHLEIAKWALSKGDEIAKNKIEKHEPRIRVLKEGEEQLNRIAELLKTGHIGRRKTVQMAEEAIKIVSRMFCECNDIISIDELESYVSKNLGYCRTDLIFLGSTLRCIVGKFDGTKSNFELIYEASCGGFIEDYNGWIYHMSKGNLQVVQWLEKEFPLLVNSKILKNGYERAQKAQNTELIQYLEKRLQDNHY